MTRLESEKSRLQKQRIQREAEQQRLVAAMSTVGSPVEAVVQRLSEIECKVATLDQRISELHNEIASLGGNAVNLDHVTATLAEFDGLWDVLIRNERSRLVQLLVERVACSAGNETLVVFRIVPRN